MSEKSFARFRYLLAALGLAEIAVGLIAAFYGPLEIYVFYFFSGDGRFAYPGFGMGSLWFAALVAHNLAYYLLAATLLPLGYATMRHYAWAARASLALAWLWLLLGIEALILVLTYAFTAFSPAEMAAHPDRVVIIGVGLVLAGIVLPVLFIWLFNRPETHRILSVRSGFADWIDKRPLPLLLAILGCGLAIVALHLMVFVQAFWPMFGTLSVGRANMYPIAATIVVLTLATTGLAAGKRLGLWGAAAAVALLFTAFVTTFWQKDIPDLMATLDLSETEQTWLVAARLPDTPFLLLASGLPLGGILVLLALSWPYFSNASKTLVWN